MARTYIISEKTLQLSDFRPHDVETMIEDCGNPTIDIAPNPGLLRFQIDEVHSYIDSRHSEARRK